MINKEKPTKVTKTKLNDLLKAFSFKNSYLTKKGLIKEIFDTKEIEVYYYNLNDDIYLLRVYKTYFNCLFLEVSNKDIIDYHYMENIPLALGEIIFSTK